MTQLTREQATRPQPTTLHPNDAALEALAEARAASVAAQTATDHILHLLQRADHPAQLYTVSLTANGPNPKELRNYQRSASIGLYNPSPATIFLGIGGVSATAQGRALSVPASAALVLPVSAQQVEVGAAAGDLAAGDAVFYILRFEAVQAFFFGGI